MTHVCTVYAYYKQAGIGMIRCFECGRRFFRVRRKKSA